MNNLARTLSLLAASFLTLFAQSQNRRSPELWAVIGVAEPLVFEDPNHDVNISFGLVNDSDIIADTDFGSWKILINGQKVPALTGSLETALGQRGRVVGKDCRRGRHLFSEKLFRLESTFPSQGHTRCHGRDLGFPLGPS